MKCLSTNDIPLHDPPLMLGLGSQAAYVSSDLAMLKVIRGEIRGPSCWALTWVSNLWLCSTSSLLRASNSAVILAVALADSFKAREISRKAGDFSRSIWLDCKSGVVADSAMTGPPLWLKARAPVLWP